MQASRLVGSNVGFTSLAFAVIKVQPPLLPSNADWYEALVQVMHSRIMAKHMRVSMARVPRHNSSKIRKDTDEISSLALAGFCGVPGDGVEQYVFQTQAA